MKRIKVIIYVLFLGMLFAFVSPEKKLNKLVSKIWKGQEVTLTKIATNDSIQKIVSQLNEIHVDGKFVGFACYTTANGCRIGGCAAPSNSNNQSYETFDYIVVYNPELEIIKVDIANYSGQYGYEICRSKWLAQFNGGTNGFQLNENIDGISGATVSATYLIDGINHVGSCLKRYFSLKGV